MLGNHYKHFSARIGCHCTGSPGRWRQAPRGDGLRGHVARYLRRAAHLAGSVQVRPVRMQASARCRLPPCLQKLCTACQRISVEIMLRNVWFTNYVASLPRLHTPPLGIADADAMVCVCSDEEAADPVLVPPPVLRPYVVYRLRNQSDVVT